jgi:adhesin HecA-like repeat protein
VDVVWPAAQDVGGDKHYDVRVQAVGGQGKPVRVRRGPATVTGEACCGVSLTQPPFRDRGREGAAGRPGSQETCLRPQPNSPRGKGWLMSHVRRPLVLGALVGTALATTGVAAADAVRATKSGTRVSVRVEGIKRTLVSATTLTTRSRPIDPDGRPADSCTGDTAAVALQDATQGRWTAGKYSPSLGYPVVGIKGESHSFSSAYYWALWINGKAASTGICGATLHAGDHILFFVQCSMSTASQCPDGSLKPPVLALRGPNRARAGRTVTVTVRALDNASGKPSAASTATVRAAGKAFHVNSRGQAKLSFARTGRYVVVATAAGSVRDEKTIVVR